MATVPKYCIVRLLGLGTAVPAHVLALWAVAQVAHDMFESRHVDYERLAPVFQTSGINTRYRPARPDLRLTITGIEFAAP